MATCQSYRGKDKGKVSKVKYVTREAAELAIRELYKVTPQDNKAVVPYLCNKCMYWHFGKPTARNIIGLSGYSDRQTERHDEILVGKLIGIIRGTYPAKPRVRLHGKRASS